MSRIKPVSDVKANAAEVLAEIASFEEMRQNLALMKLIALSQQDVAASRVRPIEDVVARLRAKLP